jgi:hypothetical protein
MTDVMTRTDTSAVVACSLSEADQARRSEAVMRDLFAFAEEVAELPDGYAWRFPGDGGWDAKLLDFIAEERTCCANFHVELVFEPRLGPLWLRLRGPDGVKAFITETFFPI